MGMIRTRDERVAKVLTVGWGSREGAVSRWRWIVGRWTWRWHGDGVRLFTGRAGGVG